MDWYFLFSFVCRWFSNYNYISIEIVGNKFGDLTQFLQAVQNAFWKAAIELKYYKLPVNRNTVRLHCELDVGTYTECPKRSMIEHGGWDSTNRQPQEAINKVKDYYIKEIKKYYDNPKLKPNETASKPKVNSNYWDTASRIEVLKDVPTYNKNFTKQDPNWKLKKGTGIDTSGIVITSSGSTHARVGENPNLFVTLSKEKILKLFFCKFSSNYYEKY